MPVFTQKDYRDAFNALLDGARQLEPDGGVCSICGDNDHQAWECHHNPLSINYVHRTKFWRCFHCDTIFTDYKEARKHFGNIPGATPHCVIKKCLCDQCPANPTECAGKG